MSGNLTRCRKSASVHYDGFAVVASLPTTPRQRWGFFDFEAIIGKFDTSQLFINLGRT